jgi:hypothetical protein
MSSDVTSFSQEKISMSTVSEKTQKRLNITLTGDDVDLMEKLRLKLNEELAMKLSMAQVVKRLLYQATANS